MPKTALPRFRPVEKRGGRRTTWAELLNDLFYTAIIMQLGNRLLESLEWPAFGQFMLLFVPIWWLWNGETHYSTRFDDEGDAVHRLLGNLQLPGLAVLAATIPTALETETSSITYAAAYSYVRSLLLAEYARAWRYAPQTRPYIRHIMRGFGVSVLIWAGSTLLPTPYRYYAWGLALLIELSTPLTTTGNRLHQEFPPDVRHLPERYGLFTLLVLGQSVTSATQALIQAGLKGPYILTALLGSVVIVGLWWAYFDRLDDDAVRQVSEGGPARPYAFWLYLHLPLTIALALTGVGFMYAIRRAAEPVLPERMQWLFAGSVGSYLLIEAAISYTTLRSGPPHESFVWGMVARTVAAIGVLALPLIGLNNSISLLGATTVIIIALILTDQFTEPAPDSQERIGR